MEPCFVSSTPPIRRNGCLDVSREIAHSKTRVVLWKAKVCKATVKEWSWFESSLAIAWHLHREQAPHSRPVLHVNARSRWGSCSAIPILHTPWHLPLACGRWMWGCIHNTRICVAGMSNPPQHDVSRDHSLEGRGGARVSRT